MRNKDLIKYYDEIFAKGEHQHFSPYLAGRIETNETKEALKEANWRNKKVLELGCGTGNFVYHVAERGARVLGTDLSKEAIKIASKKHKLPNLKFEQKGIEQVKGKYDIIVSLGVLEHMDEPFKTLKTFKQHLKPSGKIIITCPNWLNIRGYMLITLFLLFNAPITLYDLHYLTPNDFKQWSKQLNMRLKWRTFEHSWAHGTELIKDFKRRLPNVLKGTGLPCAPNNINNLIEWIEKNIMYLKNRSKHNGAIALYVLSKRGTK